MKLLPSMLSRIQQAGVSPSTAIEVVPLQPPNMRRAVFYLRSPDGREIKVRLVPRPQVRQRMERWIPRLDPRKFPRLITSTGRIVIEKWMPGQSLKHYGCDQTLIEESGRTLADVHQTLEVMPVLPQSFHFRERLRHLKASLETLYAAKIISADASRATFEYVMHRIPQTAHWGLIHRDFSQANLIVQHNWVCCIDNVDVVPGLLEEDLATTFFRWPMTNQELRNFLSGYRLKRVSESWATNRCFWTTLALVSVAAGRLKSSWPNVNEPIAQLDALGLAC
jgi:hypothetical protein